MKEGCALPTKTCKGCGGRFTRRKGETVSKYLNRRFCGKECRYHKGSLSPRHKQVVGMLAQGKRYKQIAFELGISEGTIKTYIHLIGQRLRCSGVPEILVWHFNRIISEIRTNGLQAM